MQLCLCGCGGEVVQTGKWWKPKFINGHNRRNAKWTSEQRKKVENTWSDEKFVSEFSELMERVMSTPSAKVNTSRASKKRWLDPIIRKKTLDASNQPEVKERLSNSLKIALNQPDVLANNRLRMIQRWLDPNEREKLIVSKNTPEVLAILSSKAKKRWQDPVFRENTIKAIFESRDFNPNNTEMFLNYILQQNFPNMWRFVGDGQIFIAGKVPDFINIDKKLIIEMYGDFYHKQETDSGKARKEHFKKYGYSTLIIWEHELYNNYDCIVEKIRDFIQEEVK